MDREIDEGIERWMDEELIYGWMKGWLDGWKRMDRNEGKDG